MKYTMKWDNEAIIDLDLKWQVEKIDLEVNDLIPFLKNKLVDIMDGILDPDIAGKKPDGFIKNLQSGRMGDFSKRYMLSAKDKDKIIGLLIALPHDNNGLHIYSIGVIPSCRKLGVGSDLVKKCIIDLHNNEMESLSLNVHSDNAPAYKLFKKLGFNII